LHGFGSTKEDYADIIRQEQLNDYPFIAYDAPGCGETFCSKLELISIPFLVKTAIAVLEHTNTKEFHLVGHSMGGLTSLILANQFQNEF
jgi:pimeloyl-ACP methyl ester carboxylesterase